MAKKNHGHHGGAWKVAYADFVTAMMALFLVLWLTSQDTRIKQAVERTFKNPFASVTKESTGILPSTEAQAVKSSSGNWESASAVELTMLRRIAEDFVKILESNPEDPSDNPVQLEMTPEGVRISVFDRARKAIFHDNSAQFTDYGNWVFTTLAWELARFSGEFQIELEGHTERKERDPALATDDWDLTADRANTARHKILEHGVRAGQIQKVAGFADRQPINGAAPSDEANRRVTVQLKIRTGQRT